MVEPLTWPILAVAAVVVAALAFRAGRRWSAGAAARAASTLPDRDAAATVPQYAGFEDDPLREEMLGVMRLLEKAGEKSVVLDVATRVLGSSGVRMEAAVERLSTLGLVTVHSPVRRPDFVVLTDSGRVWLGSHPPPT